MAVNTCKCNCLTPQTLKG